MFLTDNERRTKHVLVFLLRRLRNEKKYDYETFYNTGFLPPIDRRNGNGDIWSVFKFYTFVTKNKTQSQNLNQLEGLDIRIKYEISQIHVQVKRPFLDIKIIQESLQSLGFFHGTRNIGRNEEEHSLV